MNNAVLLTCPTCGTSLPQQVQWMRVCAACGSKVRVDLFPAAFRSVERGQAGETILDDAESGCFYHPAKRAVIPCDVCGRFLCALCDLEVEGRHICPTCLSRERTTDTNQRPKEGRTLYDRIAFDVAILTLVLPCLWYIVPIPVTFIGLLCVKYWNAPRSVLSHGKWRMGISAVMAVAMLAIWVFVIIGVFAWS